MNRFRHNTTELARSWPGRLFLGALLLAASLGYAQEPSSPAAPRQLDDPRDVLARYPALTARPRTPVLEEHGYFPCTDCHDNEYQLANPQVRVLEEMHDDIVLDHGGGRFWCLTCHHETERDQLTSLKGQPISFDEAFLLCGQCHFQRQRDFFFGAHGKRLEGWQVPRVVQSCPECHNPHQPAIGPRVPYPPPEVRRGLSRREDHEEHRTPLPWERETEPGEPAAGPETAADPGHTEPRGENR